MTITPERPPRFSNQIPVNYHLSFSLADGNNAASIAAIDNGMNVAAVFRNNVAR